MSTIDRCTIEVTGEAETRSAGHSLAHTLYRKSLTILLHGELGAGKTTFVQGFAEGLGLKSRVVSPTYALEQRYDDILSHIDLYRLGPAQAKEFMAHHAEEFPGIRTVEWGERDPTLTGDIAIEIHEDGPHKRRIECEFRDIPVPSASDITGWIADVRLPPHIVKHMDAVADAALRIGHHLNTKGILLRPKALEAAAKVHDLLRFVDFVSWEGSEMYQTTEEDRARWTVVKNEFGSPHELAAKRFLETKGFPALGAIVEHHRGYAKGVGPLPLKTIEGTILAYADKRVKFDTFVSLDERFDDFAARYGKGIESEDAKLWRAHMKKIEADLFGGAAPL